MYYKAVKAKELSNTGYGWKVSTSTNTSDENVNNEIVDNYIDSTESESIMKGGPLKGVYRLEQFHSHWGEKCDIGSEHTVDGQAFAGELHFVHWNAYKYENFTEAESKDDGLAVLGVFLKAGKANAELQKIVNLLSNIMFRGERVDFPGFINMDNLLPKHRNYWTYSGSLTTPPCSEGVTWIIFKDPIEVSEEQLDAFRNLRRKDRESCSNQSDDLVLNNFRPPAPLGNRLIRESLSTPT